MFEEKICEICFDKTKEVVLACAHAFCEGCISDWTKKDKHCPYCREDLSSAMKNAMRRYSA